MDRYNVCCTYNRYSAYLTHAPTMLEAVAKAQWSRAFYEPMYPGTLKIEISVACDRCNGIGRLVKGRKSVRFPKYIDCPACAGNGYFPIPAVA